MKWISVFLLIFSTSVFGADYTVYSWGYGDILGETLQMIAFLFHYDDYKDAWKLTLSLALFVGAMATVIPNSDILKVPKIFLLSTGVWSAFAVAQVSIEIDDLTNTGNNKVINGVPWAVGYPMSLISALDYKLGQAYESASSIPATLRYTDGGMMLPLNLFNSSLSYKITDTRLSQNVYNYSIECALPDFDDGIKDYDLAMQSTDLWSYMGGTNPAVLVEYIKSDGTKEVKSCTDAYSSINSDMTTYFSASGKAMQNLATQMGFGSAAAISSKLGTTHQWLHGATASANTMLMQNASINAFNGAFKSYAAMNASNSESLAMYAGKAESVASSNMIVSGILGSKYIPVTKGILMSVVAGLTPMLALIMLTPLAFKSFVGYLTMLMWLATWHLGEIILNHLVSVKAQGVIDAYADSTLTSMTKPLVESTSLDYINMISSMYWMVPTISGLIVGGFSMGALAMMTGGITGRVAKGEAVGSEMGTGSWQSGNIRMDNTTANKHDSTSMLGMGQAYNIQREGFGANNLTTTQGMTSQSNQSVVSGAMQGISQGLNTIAGHHGGGNVGANWSANTQVKNNADGSSYQNGTWTNVGTDGTVTQLSGAMTFGKNGEILSGTGIKYTSTDSSGKTVSGEFDYNNGELTHSKIRNENGTTVETTYNGDGTSTQNVTTSSGSKGTFTIDENGRAKDIKNVDMAQVKATEEYAKQKAVEKATSGVLTEAFKKSFTHSDTEGKDTSVNDTTGYSKDNTTANVAQVSPTSGLNAFSGLFKGKGGFGGALANATNIATKAVGVTLTDSDSISTNKSGQLVVTNKDGKTDTYQLDDSSTKQLQQLYAQKESEVSGQKFSTNEPIRNLFKDEQAKNSNETAVETLERMDSNISKTERDLKNGVIASNPEPNSVFANDVKGEIQKVDDATKTDEQITTNGTSVTNNQNPEYQQAKKDFLGNFAKASKETQDGVKEEAAMMLGATVAGIVGTKFAPQIQEAFEKKFSKATDFEKAVNDIEQATKKVETAIDTGKGGAGTKKAFEDLGLGEVAKKNGFVFDSDGSVNEKATAFKQNALKAEGKLEETFGNRPQVSKGVEQVGREEFTKRIDEAITHSKDPKEIKGLNALKQDVIDGKPISNKRMANFGFGAGAPVHEPIKVGSTVQAFDKGHSNYGTVTGFNKDGTASVHFKNNTTGNEATAKIAQEDLKNVKSVPQSGNFDFNKAGASIVASNPELKSQVHPSSSVHNQPSVHGNSDVHTPKAGGFFSMVVSTIGLTAFAGAAANADENVGKYVEAGLNLASGAASLLIPTPLGQGSDLPPVNSPEMAKFTSAFPNMKINNEPQFSNIQHIDKHNSQNIDSKKSIVEHKPVEIGKNPNDQKKNDLNLPNFKLPFSEQNTDYSINTINQDEMPLSLKNNTSIATPNEHHLLKAETNDTIVNYNKGNNQVSIDDKQNMASPKVHDKSGNINTKEQIEATPKVHHHNIELPHKNIDNSSINNTQPNITESSNVPNKGEVTENVSQINRIDKHGNNTFLETKDTSIPGYDSTNRMEYTPEDNLKKYNSMSNYDPEKSLKQESQIPTPLGQGSDLQTNPEDMAKFTATFQNMNNNNPLQLNGTQHINKNHTSKQNEDIKKTEHKPAEIIKNTDEVKNNDVNLSSDKFKAKNNPVTTNYDEKVYQHTIQNQDNEPKETMNIKNNIEITPRVHQADVVLSNQNPNNINATHPQPSTLYPSNVTTNRKTKDVVFDKANEKDNQLNNKIEKLEDNKVSSKKNTSSPTYNPTNKMEYNPEDNMKTYNPTPNYDPEVKLKAESHKIDKIISSKE